mmetsp:Transcript_6652/g.6777  ORF Transcript_6652/g.6777 Transcript_6652/m.6777 type:complete len:555 (+) Transcript_6652:134-1798(+)
MNIIKGFVARFNLSTYSLFPSPILISMASLLLQQTQCGASSSSPSKILQVGLTGSIGMGKSACTNHFRSMGFPVFDADAAVHKLYSTNGAAVDRIKLVYPDAIIDAAVSRPILGKKVMENSAVLKVLEDIVHPLVAAERRLFFDKAKDQGHFLVIYDIPLLLENPSNHDVDYVVVATADAATQRDRVLKRPGMTEDKFLSLLAKQMPDEQKRKLADYLIHTDHDSYAPAKAQVASIIENIIEKHPILWSRWKLQGSERLKEKSSSIADSFDLVVFDLDDTLVPVFDPIKVATEALSLHMDEFMPLTAEEMKVEKRLWNEMSRISKENPLLAHDLTEVRKAALRALATPHNEQDRVDDAINLFVSMRSHVAPHLYEDVIPCLEWLTKDIGVHVAVLTNGNANLTTCDVLGQYITLSIGACEVGVMKPSPVPFIAISQRTGIPASRILFIGDSLEKDVQGARAAGMTAALLLRDDYKDQRVSRLVSATISSERTTVIDPLSIKTTIETEITSLSSTVDSTVDTPQIGGDKNEYIILKTLYPEELKEKVDKFLEIRL